MSIFHISVNVTFHFEINLPGKNDFFIFWEVGVVIESFKASVSWWEAKGFGSKIKLALLERHKTSRRKKTWAGLVKNLQKWQTITWNKAVLNTFTSK